MSTKKITRNYIYHLAYQALSIFIPLITTPYLSRVLGADSIGEYSFSNAFASYFIILATLGTTIYGQRIVAYNSNNRISLSHVFWNTFFFRLILTFIAVSLYLGYITLFDKLNLLNLVLALSILNVGADITWLFQGLEKFDIILFRNLIIRTICTVSIFAFVKAPEDNWKYCLIIAGSTLVGNISLWLGIKNYIVKVKHIKPFSEIKEIFLIFLPTVAIQIYAVLDKTMLGWIVGSNYEVGCYEEAEKIVRISLIMVTSLGAVVLPRVANLFSNDDIEMAKKHVYLSYRFTWLMSLPIMAGLIAISSTLIPVFLGEGYDAATELVVVFSCLPVFVGLSYTTGLSYLIPSHQQNVYTIAVFVAAVINLIMNSFLIRRYSAIGAAIASITAEGVGCVIQIAYCCKNKQLLLSRILFGAWKYLLSSIVMFLVICVVKNYVLVNPIGLLLLILTGVATYFCGLIILRDEYVLKIVRRFLERN